MSEKFLMFTWQPTWILMQGDACQFTGIDNVGEITYNKADKYFKYFLTAGAVLSHDRQWELLAVRSLGGGEVTLAVKDPINLDEQEIKPFATIAENTEEVMNKMFGAGEELLVSTASAPSAVMFLVQEYKPGNRS